MNHLCLLFNYRFESWQKGFQLSNLIDLQTYGAEVFSILKEMIVANILKNPAVIVGELECFPHVRKSPTSSD